MKSNFLNILWLFCTTISLAQVNFTTKVSKKKLGVNQRLRVEFTIDKQGGDHFAPPSFKDFEVLGGPSQSVNQSWINGKSSYAQTYTYIVTPLKKGALKIQGATIEYKGKRIQSNPIDIAVVAATELPKDPNDPDYIANQNVHLEVLISNKKPYVGEGIYVEYRLYFSNKIGINDFDFKELPAYKGFWNQEIKIDQIQAKNGEYDGEDYRYFTLKKTVLIPQKSGKLYLEPIRTDLILAVPTGRGDFFGNPITRNIRKSFKTFKQTIQVKPLPEQGKPADFNGAVGDFSLAVTTSKPFLKANESTQLKVKIKGKGNLKLFEIPSLSTPKELEVYAPEHQEKLRTAISGIRGLQGEVFDQYTVVPEFKGKYKIPRVSFSYFNPKEKKYHTLVSDPIYVNVTEGKELLRSTTGSNTLPTQQLVKANESFRYISNHTVFESTSKKDFFKSPLFYGLLLLPLLSIPLGVFVGKKQKQRANDLIGSRTRKADKLARKYLSQAKKQLGKKEAFYIALEKALYNYLKAKLQIETSEISKEYIRELLEDRAVSISSIDDFIAVLNDCDFARYAPVTDVMMHEEFSKAKEVIAALDKQL
ncbi:MAG: BatD family protein [Flavicella sp.]